MSHCDCKVFNMNDCRPQVLLMGNGLTYNTGVPWHELIRKVARDKADIEKYEKKNEAGNFIGFHVPNTVLTLATSETDDTKRHQKYGDALKGSKYSSIDCLGKLLSLPFDAVLTTNYTYELEATLCEKYPGLSEENKRKYAFWTSERSEGKYLLRTCNRLKLNAPDIWHIHGELRRPSSIILSHDEYARLVHQVLEYNKSRGREYEKYRNELKFQSWVDYFLMGDVYVLGLALDFAEFDLWWLLGRRLRERAGCGKFIFYEPGKMDNHYKLLALQDAGVDVRSCGITIHDGSDYARFYKQAMKDIQSQVSKGKMS